MSEKSVEQRLFEAFKDSRGVYLSAQDVRYLIAPDDALCTRISNRAASEVGLPEPGCDFTSRVMTWEELQRISEES